MYGNCVSNRRIEPWRGNAEASGITLLDALFKDLRDKDDFKTLTPFYVECVGFCFIDLIKQN